MSTSKDWSPWRKWWMDVAKWFVGSLAGFLLSFFVFGYFEERRSEQRTQCASRVDSVRRALVGFEIAASAYRTATYNAFNELYRWRSDQPTDPIRNWWTVAYPSIDAALRNLDTAYPKTRGETKTFRDLSQSVFSILDRDLIDPRLDDIERAYAASANLTDEQQRTALRPIPRYKLDNRKSEIETYSAQLEATQSKIAATIAAALSRPPSEFCKSGHR